jgi:hypothetical protein
MGIAVAGNRFRGLGCVVDSNGARGVRANGFAEW